MRDRLIELMKKQRNGKKKVSMSYEEFADYLIANGVIVPPVSIGCTVYTIRGKKLLKKWKVLFIGINSLGEIKINIADKGFKNVLEVWDCNFGKNVFITIEDAEKEIEERSNENAE